jgi:hypothetical protein
VVRLRERHCSFRGHDPRFRVRLASLREHAAGLRGRQVSRAGLGLAGRSRRSTTQVLVSPKSRGEVSAFNDTEPSFNGTRSAFSDKGSVFNGCCRDTTATSVSPATPCPRTSGGRIRMSVRVPRMSDRLPALAATRHGGPGTDRNVDRGRTPADRGPGTRDRVGTVRGGGPEWGPRWGRSWDRPHPVPRSVSVNAVNW